jgi:hypothetical protein
VTEIPTVGADLRTQNSLKSSIALHKNRPQR